METQIMRTKTAFEARQKLLAEYRSHLDGIEGDPSAEATATSERFETDIRSADEAMEAAIEADAKEARFHEAFAASGFEPAAPKTEKRGIDADREALLAFIDSPEARSVHFTAPELRSLGTGSGEGADTIDNSFYGQIIKAVREFSPLLSAGVEVINTANGEEIRVTGRTGTPVAAQIAEKGTYGKSNGSFGPVDVLRAYKYGLISQASEELLQDSAFNVMGEVAEMGGEAIALGIGADFMNGNGSDKPLGILTATPTGTFAAAAAITPDELIDVTHSIKQAYRRNAGWVLNDDTVKVARKLKDADGNYIWRAGLTADAPDTLLGYGITTDPEMPVVGTGNKSVLFGDLRRGFVVRFAQGVSVERSDEYAWDEDLVSWKWRVRVDSAIKDATAFAVWDQA